MKTPQIRSMRSTPPPHIHGTKEKRNEMFGNSTITSQRVDRHDKGFTLIEILIAIVLIGVLSAVAVVGISSLLSKGSASACQASADSAKAAGAVFFAANGNTYPVDFLELTTATPADPTATPPTPFIEAALTMPTGVGYSGANLVATSGSSWKLTMDVTKTPPTFTCGTP
jgi:prepilin-type N-terminal cleavage/methylation domain-containing protein